MDNFTRHGLALLNKTLEGGRLEREIIRSEQVPVNETIVSDNVPPPLAQGNAPTSRFSSVQDAVGLDGITESESGLLKQSQQIHMNVTSGSNTWSLPMHTSPLDVSEKSVNGNKSELPLEPVQLAGSQIPGGLPSTEARTEYEYGRTTSMEGEVDTSKSGEVYTESNVEYDGEENGGPQFADFVDDDNGTGSETDGAAGSIAGDMFEDMVVGDQNNTGTYIFSAGEFGVVFSEPDTDGLDDLDSEQVEPTDQDKYEAEGGTSATYNDFNGIQNSADISTVQLQTRPLPGVFGMSKEEYLARQKPTTQFPTLSVPTMPGPPATLTTPAVPKPANHRSIFVDLEHLANYSRPYCNISSHFRSWETHMVTQMGVPITRDCRKLTINSRIEINKVKSQVVKWRATKPWEMFALKFKWSCDYIREEFLNNFYVSKVEQDFPIAYIFVVYTNAGQVIRLLKSIYRPQNMYCIHPDVKQGEKFADFFRTISKCLDNVFVVSRPLSVHYAHHSIMDAQLNCMVDLMRYPNRWKYVINLCGREIPLKTNREIVEALIKLKGYTALDMHHLTPIWWQRRFRFQFRLGPHGYMHQTRVRQKKPPYGIKIYKSMNFIAASQDFVKFILYNKRAKVLRNYLKSVYAPEEHYYSSLYALPYANGGAPKRGEIGRYDMPEVDQFIWIANRYQTSHAWRLCPGRKIVHSICILTTPDMGKIERNGLRNKRPFFFFNKYFLEWDPIPMDCMEERLVRTNIEEYKRDCLVGNFYIPSFTK